ncbi:MAG TPA: carboxypeptidase-like regulatory domain-containing protein [Candidatus Thermoplasmatota archaeon]|nr:carboxypeptidase-like regulatory domain-containing protein [Candidatus Thermoplasmatota archaeon]
MVKWVVALLVGLALAGCAAKPGSDDPASPCLDCGGMEEDKTTGTMVGVLVDDAVRPVPGGTVRLPDGSSARTGPQGDFQFGSLAPGSYLVAANATGFLPASSVVQVEAGKEVHARLQLAKAVAVKPSHQTLKFKGTVQASAGLATTAADRLAGGLTTCTCAFPFASTGPLVSILVEAVWEDVLPDPAGPTKYNWEVLVDGNDARAAGQGPSPIRHEVQRLDFSNRSFDFGAHPDYTLHVYPDAVWPTVNQEYQAFVTLWYLERPPADFSIVKGSEVTP